MAAEIGGLYATIGLNTAPLESGLKASTQQLDAFQKQMSGKVKFAVQDLSFQLQDIVAQLSTGTSPFRILLQQGGQVAGAFQAGGGVGPVLKGLATTIRGLITPATLAVGAFAAITAGAVLLTRRAADSTESARQFDLTLRALGANGLTTGANMEATAKSLRSVGLSAVDARAKLLDLTRSGINPAQAGRVITTGQDIGAITGSDGIEALKTALSGGLESTIKLGLQLRAFTADEISSWREMARIGQESTALSQAFDKLEQKFKGLNNESLTPLSRAMRDLGVAFNDTMNNIANSNVVTRIARGFSIMAQGLATITAGGKIGDAAYAPIPPATTKTTTTTGTLDAATLVKAVIAVESGGNPLAVSPTGAQGLMQLMPATSARFGVVNPFNAKENVIGGTKYLQFLLQHYNGDVELALMAYYWGEGNLDKALAAGKSPPPGVKNYAKNVLAKYDALIGTTTPGTSSTPTGGADIANQNTAQAASDLDQIIKERERQIKVLQGVGAAADVERAKQEAASIAAEKHLDASQKDRLEAELINNVYKQREIEQNKVIQLTEQEITAIRNITAAYQKSSFAGLQAESTAKAQAEAFQALGTTSGALYDKMVRERSTQLINAAQYGSLQDFAKSNANDNQQIEVLRLENSLVGETQEHIDRQVALLKVKQQAEAVGLNITNEEVQARLKSVNALYDANDALVKTQRQMDQIKEFAGTLEGSFSTIFDTITSGTFKLRDAISTVLKDVAKFLTNSAVKALLYGESSGGVGGGLLGSIGSALGLGSLFGGGSSSGGPGLVMKPGGIMDTEGFAGGGSFEVGGAGAIDSKLVAFRATPGEMVNVHKPGQASSVGSNDAVRIELTHSDAFVSNVADQRIKTHAGTIIDIAVKQSTKNVGRNFNSMATEAQARRA